MCSFKLGRCVNAYAPGKFMLAGEWAVLELGNPCIALPYHKGVSVRIQAVHPEGRRSRCLEGSAVRSTAPAKTVFVRSACEAVKKYLDGLGITPRPFFIAIDSDISTVNKTPFESFDTRNKLRTQHERNKKKIKTTNIRN